MNDDNARRFIDAVWAFPSRDQDSKQAVERLFMYRDMLFASLPIQVGDRVRIAKDLGITYKGVPGWWCSREALAVGRTGVAHEVDYNEFRKAWQVAVMLDEDWVVVEDFRSKDKNAVKRVKTKPNDRPLYHINMACLERLEGEV